VLVPGGLVAGRGWLRVVDGGDGGAERGQGISVACRQGGGETVA
jgi:hypothetical protein